MIKLQEEAEKREDEREKRRLLFEEKIEERRMRSEEQREQRMFTMFMSIMNQFSNHQSQRHGGFYNYPSHPEYSYTCTSEFVDNHTELSEEN